MPKAGKESRDGETFPSAAIDEATSRLWRAVTGQAVPTGASTKYDQFREAVVIMCNAAVVTAYRRLDRDRGVRSPK